LKNNISILINSLEGGGAERVVTHLIKYLSSKNLNVILVLISDNILFDIPKGVKVLYLKKAVANETVILKFLQIPWLAYKYSTLLRKNQISVSISFLARSNYINIISGVFAGNSRRIISERSFPSQQYGDASIQSKVNNFLIKKLYPKAHLIISNSLGNAKDLEMNYKIQRSNIQTIYNPIDIQEINNTAPLNNFMNSNFINFISVGRLDTAKNHSFLIDVIDKLDRENVRLYIFGEGELRESLNEKIQKLNLSNQIFLMGFTPNPIQYMKVSDAFLFGSKSEGFPNVLLEALASSLPIISTNCKSGPNEILFNKIIEIDSFKVSELGILVPLDNVSEYVKAVRFFLDNRELFFNFEIKGQKKIVNYTFDKVLEEYYKCLTV
tara:strand:+ start:8105 stop:9250 length:1146 start_codon:yes stop_codon:yes gene_type:complete